MTIVKTILQYIDNHPDITIKDLTKVYPYYRESTIAMALKRLSDNGHIEYIKIPYHKGTGINQYKTVTHPIGLCGDQERIIKVKGFKYCPYCGIKL